MPTRVKLYIGVVITAGVGSAAWSFTKATQLEPQLLIAEFPFRLGRPATLQPAGNAVPFSFWAVWSRELVARR